MLRLLLCVRTEIYRTTTVIAEYCVRWVAELSSSMCVEFVDDVV
jgi:hypothetical protein